MLAERRRSLERERGASVDAAVIASLEAEAARLAPPETGPGTGGAVKRLFGGLRRR